MAPVMRTMKVDRLLYEKTTIMAAQMGIAPSELVEEAVMFYLENGRELILERIQERVDALFATARPPAASPS